MSTCKSSAAKAGIGYTVGNILIKGINFLAVPIFSRILTTDEFGVYNTFIAYDSIISIVLGLALHSSVRSANLEFKNEVDEYTSSVSLIYLANSAMLLGIALMFRSFLSKFLAFPVSVLIMLVLYSFGSAVLMLYNQRISLDYNFKSYLKVAFINSFGNVVVSLILILTLFRGQKDVGRILGATLTITGLAVGLLASIFKKAKPRFERKYWSFGLQYSLPIVPHGISQVLLAQFDRIMIRALVSNSAAGIYSLAGNIKLILTIITDSVSTAWQTWFYEQIEQENKDVIQTRAIQLTALFTIFAIGLMALSPELIHLLGGIEYDAGKYVAVPMILDAFILFLYNIYVSAEYYTKKTTYIMLGTIVAAIINVITNYIFIKRYGFVAAAYTTLFSYVCYLTMHIIVSKRLVNFFVLPIKWLVIYCCIATAFAGIDIAWVDSLVVRWSLCAIAVLPMTYILLTRLGIMKCLEDKREK